MKIDLKIKGMHCQSCEMLIADALKEIDVEKSEIDSNKGTATIEFDENKINLKKIKKVITEEGYKVV